MAITAAPRIKAFESAPHFSAEGMKDRADLAVEALKLTLGDGVDYEKMREEFARDFAKIANANGECGETYPRTPLGWVAGKALTLEAMCAMNDSILSKDGSRYPHAYPFDQPEGDISRRIWTPELGGYSFEQMNRLALPDQPEDPQARTIHARMALLNPEMPKAKEPLLHFTDQTYEQQLESVGDFSRKYGEDHPELAVHGMPAIDFAMLVRQRRIEGKPMPVEWGYMRTIQMGRAAVAGDPWVGGVYSLDGRVRFDRSLGHALPNIGVGLSAGLRETPES